jgi:DNA mismatch repair protein MutS
MNINPEDILNMVLNKTQSKSIDEKKDHELDFNDRLYLVSKTLDEQLKNNLYEKLIENKNLLFSQDNCIINDYVFNDVEFMHDHYLNEENGLISKINHCKTKVGSILLKKILLTPINNIEILQKRQTYVKKIIPLLPIVEDLFNQIKNIENDLIWFWDEKSLNHIDNMNDVIYFNWNFIPGIDINTKLNDNEYALLASNMYKIILSPVFTAITPLITVITPLILMLWFNRKLNGAVPIKTVIWNYFKTLWSDETMKIFIKSPTKAQLASLLTKGLYLFMYFQNIYNSYQSSCNTNKLINLIHDKLNKMNQYIQVSKKIEDICKQNDLIDLTNYIGYNELVEDNKFYKENYFSYEVFYQNPGLFTNKGKILKIFNKFRFYKTKLLDIFQFIGIMDVLGSLGKLINENNANYPYSYTIYKKKSKPELNIKNIWHPYLINNNVVSNSIIMKNNLLITGPNAAGKSTFIKSVIINILLSQTIGINSCSLFEITPFHLIETYLHIPDIKGKSSLFEAEMFRSKEYIEKIKDLDEKQFSFIVLDEIFSSTNYIEGFSGAYSILKNLCKYTNTLFIVTTHYTDLCILEKDTKNRIENYKFSVDYDNNKNIIFNYLLEKGVSYQYIALDLLKNNGFDEEIINDALNISKNITKSKIKKNKIKKNKIKNDKKEKDKNK